MPLQRRERGKDKPINFGSRGKKVLTTVGRGAFMRRKEMAISNAGKKKSTPGKEGKPSLRYSDPRRKGGG